MSFKIVIVILLVAAYSTLIHAQAKPAAPAAKPAAPAANPAAPATKPAAPAAKPAAPAANPAAPAAKPAAPAANPTNTASQPTNSAPQTTITGTAQTNPAPAPTGTNAAQVQAPEVQKGCGGNQTLLSNGYDCLTCANLHGSCSFESETKCYCQMGYVKDMSQDRCILPEDCTNANLCQANETRNDNGFDCYNCDNFRTESCHSLAETKCYCNQGYIRNDTGFCILPTDCTVYQPGQCRINQTYNEMGEDCYNCANYKLLSVNCALSTVAKCYCKTGYVRDMGTPRCLKPIDCPIQDGSPATNVCPANETFLDSGPDCNTCTNPSSNCAFTLQAKCYCIDGFVRNADNVCINPTDCPSAGLGVQTSACSTATLSACNRCVRTCSNRFNNIRGRACSPICSSCYCPGAEVRDERTGACVRPGQCRENPYVFEYYSYKK